MKRILFILLLLAASAPMVQANALSAPSAIILSLDEDVSQSTAEKLIEIAAEEWQLEYEDLINEYNNGDLTITEIEPGLYRLNSLTGGIIDILDQNL